MQNVNGPVLIREHDLAEPGLHSHNPGRRGIEKKPRTSRKLIILRTLFLILGVAGVGYYGYELANQHIYQVYENWAFDQQISGRMPVTFADYLRERTPFGFLVGERAVPPAPIKPPANPAGRTPPAARPELGSLLGRVEIGRLNLSAIVREGVDSGTLNRAVGHVPSTALPGQDGNFAIAAHRDTLFRALKDIHNGDLVDFQSSAGTYKYQVFSTRIVKPSDVSVLRPDGGFDAKAVVSQNGGLLTMITCYPFYYVGSAPKRFIVQARLLPAEKTAEAANNTGPPAKTLQTHRGVARATRHRTDRSPSRLHTASSTAKPKKHGIWHKLFHLG